jgi:glycosyltransferase involved in cell wall biosynthesis
MRILIALTYYRPHYSGLTIYTERVARALAARGHHIIILTSRFDEGLPERELLDGVEIIRPNVWFHISKGVIMPGMIPQAWKLIRQADVVNLHVPQLDAAPISLLSKLLGKPVVLTYHCDLRLPAGFIHSAANWVSNLANHITASAADTIVHNTRDYAEHSEFLRHYLGKIQSVFPPVDVKPVSDSDLKRFRIKFKVDPEDRIIGMAARLATEKGVEYLAQALPSVLIRYPNARVLFVGPHQDVVGEEKYAARLAHLIESLGNHWSFLGVLSPIEMAAFFHLSEVLVLPSINSTESYGMVQVEAMACSTPVVASDLPGMRIPVLETGAGRIVPPRKPEMLAEAVIDILDDPEAYRGHPEIVVDRSTPEMVAKEYESIFTSLLNPINGKTDTNRLPSDAESTQ